MLIDRAALLRGFGQVAGDVGSKLMRFWGTGAVTRVEGETQRRREICLEEGTEGTWAGGKNAQDRGP